MCEGEEDGWDLERWSGGKGKKAQRTHDSKGICKASCVAVPWSSSLECGRERLEGVGVLSQRAFASLAERACVCGV